jgi:hypothetical protein
MSLRPLAFLCACALLSSGSALAFNSGSTGADGALAPNVDTTVPLPPDGVLNYSSIDIPSGVTVRFQPNALNTPVVLLVSGNANILGAIDLNGAHGTDSNGAGNGNVGDDGLPGVGGPGGFPGGRGGLADATSNTPRTAQAGLGPGGGRPPRLDGAHCHGASASFGTTPPSGFSCVGSAGPAYGNADLLPLIGGSGGSGGSGWSSLGGAGGGGGGGAILIAVSGTLNVTGTIRSNGGHGGDVGNGYNTNGMPGGGGSGGAIRLVATTLSGNGAITATGTRVGNWGDNNNSAPGGSGRIRLEAETLQRTAQTTPAYTFAAPGPLAVAGMPRLRIASVAGIAAPATPTGGADIVLPDGAPDPLPIVVETTNVPLGNTVSVIVTPPRGNPTTVVSGAIQGSEASGTANATVSFGDGLSVLLATLSYSVSGQQALALSRYTGGEPVARVELEAGLQGLPRTVLVTDNGRRVELPAGAM